jgi:Lrp/AsnC family transcriptional regulator for asnA, asnC and gidA
MSDEEPVLGQTGARSTTGCPVGADDLRHDGSTRRAPLPNHAPPDGSHLMSTDDPTDPATPTPGRSRVIDELDRNIIRLLQVDGRMSNTEIARQLDITETTVRKRIARLLDQRLMSIVAVPSPEAVGLTLSAILGVSVDLPSMQDVAETIRTYDEVRYVGMSVGRYELIVEAFFADQEHLLEFVSKKLGQLPGIGNLETSIILKVVKFSYEWEIS